MPNTSATSICAASTTGKPNQNPGPAAANPSAKIEYRPTIGEMKANASENAEPSVNSRSSAAARQSRTALGLKHCPTRAD